MAKCGPGDIYCSLNYHRGSLKYSGVYTVRPWKDFVNVTVTNVQNGVRNLNRFVTEIKLKASYEYGSGLSMMPEAGG